MSGASSWLQKQRKADLVELSDNIGFKNYDGLKKNELELALDDYLQKNATSLQSDSRLAPYYKSASRRSESSPVKKEKDSGAVDVVKTVKRRVTKAPEDLANAISAASDEDSTAAALVQTPARALQLARNVPLPPSPAVVADAIDQRTIALRRRVSAAYEDSGVPEVVHNTRDTLSSVVSVEALIVLFEAYFLRPEVLPNRYAFTIPALHLVRTRAYPVYVPDLFLLLTSSFWGPVSLWLFTSLLVPLLGAYFINLTGRTRPATRSSAAHHFAYEFDPLVFNVVKALLTYVVYAKDATFGGWIDTDTIGRINSALYGGYASMLTGAAIGGLATLYEAAQRK